MSSTAVRTLLDRIASATTILREMVESHNECSGVQGHSYECGMAQDALDALGVRPPEDEDPLVATITRNLRAVPPGSIAPLARCDAPHIEQGNLACGEPLPCPHHGTEGRVPPILWACGNLQADHGYYCYPLDVEEGARTTTCPKCGQVDSLYIANPLALIKGKPSEGANALARAITGPPAPVADAGVPCGCWHSRNRAEDGSALKHPSGFNCTICLNTGFRRMPEGCPAHPGGAPICLACAALWRRRREES